MLPVLRREQPQPFLENSHDHDHTRRNPRSHPRNRCAMNAAEIAAKLTKAQREGLLRGWGTVGIARALKTKGLSSGYLGSDPRAVAIVTTELGHAVEIDLRAILQAKEPTDER